MPPVTSGTAPGAAAPATPKENATNAVRRRYSGAFACGAARVRFARLLKVSCAQSGKPQFTNQRWRHASQYGTRRRDAEQRAESRPPVRNALGIRQTVREGTPTSPLADNKQTRRTMARDRRRKGRERHKDETIKAYEHAFPPASRHEAPRPTTRRTTTRSEPERCKSPEQSSRRPARLSPRNREGHQRDNVTPAARARPENRQKVKAQRSEIVLSEFEKRAGRDGSLFTRCRSSG
jgi:hypothetical protein